MSRRNCGVFPSLAGGHSDRPAPEALRANAPISVSATDPPMTPTVRGLRFPRRHRSSLYRCARRSPSFAAHCARQSALCAFGRAARSVLFIARSASCTGAGCKRLLIGGIPGSGIPENGSLIFLRPRRILVSVRWRGEKTEQESCNWSPSGIGAARLERNPLIPNRMESQDRNCICPTSSRDGEQTGPSRAMCEEDPGRAGRRQPNCGLRLTIILGVFRKN